MTNGAKNHPQDKAKNRLQDAPKNRPDIINPVSLLGVVDEVFLKALLKRKRQSAWCSRVRLRGLLLLIDYFCRDLKNGAIAISADLAHQYVSKLRKRPCDGTVCEPLLLLCEIGILRRMRPAVFAHIKTSAVYCFADPYRKTPVELALNLPPKLASKLKFAEDRCECRLNHKYPFRKQLLADLATLSFSDSSRRIIATGLQSKGGETLKRLMQRGGCARTLC
jgi:hypothetical protein